MFACFKQRGGSSPDEVEVPGLLFNVLYINLYLNCEHFYIGADCRLKDASNTTHIPKLSLKVS